MSQTTRKAVLKRLRRRYRNAGREHRRKLLDQAEELLGYHRKSAVRTLSAPEMEPAPWINAGRPVSREPSVLLPWLRPIWQATDSACGRRLVAMLPEWPPAYEAHERRLPAEAQYPGTVSIDCLGKRRLKGISCLRDRVLDSKVLTLRGL